MAYEHKDGSGSIFKNQYKKTDKQPDYKGDLMYNGELLEIALWVKEGKNGKFFSAKVQPKRVEQPADYAKGNRSPHNPKMSSAIDDDFGDDIPF